MIWQQEQLMKGTSCTAYLPMLFNTPEPSGLKHSPRGFGKIFREEIMLQ